ncbi:DUF106 domain-containing protein [Candidatus Pacearchaeota archaeon]|nr:DUF106 domain-containing protein [Candidatus Pacearchaeota archaeon]
MIDYISIINQNPEISIVVISLAITFLITLVNYFFLDKDKVRGIKSRQKELQTQMKEHQRAGNTDKMMELQKELFSSTGEMMKHSLKPMLITMIPILLLFGFVRNIFADTTIASSWFWYYLVSAIAGSMIFRKIFNLP